MNILYFLSVFILRPLYSNGLIPQERMSAKVKSVPWYWPQSNRTLEITPIHLVNVTTNTEAILKVLASGYLKQDINAVEIGSSLPVQGRRYWYGKFNNTASENLCKYEVPPDYDWWAVFDRYDARVVVREIFFECHPEHENCCELSCCTNVYLACYVVLGLATSVLILALVLGVFVKFSDEITLLMFHLKMQKFKRKKVKQMIKNDDANYCPAEED